MICLVLWWARGILAVLAEGHTQADKQANRQTVRQLDMDLMVIIYLHSRERVAGVLAQPGREGEWQGLSLPTHICLLFGDSFKLWLDALSNLAH
jgi:hypothetical protein